METAIRQFRVRNQIPARLIVEAIRRGYPKFDAPMLSRVESGAYGAELPKDAYALLQSHFPAADFTMFQRHKGRLPPPDLPHLRTPHQRGLRRLA